MKRTPGPWEARNNVFGDPSITNTSGTFIATTFLERLRGYKKSTRYANARLIAAAPDLLEACKGIEVVYANLSSALPEVANTPAFDLINDAVKSARSAIAKAEGRAI